MHDTSHYTECADLMLKFRRNYMIRLITLAICMLLNLYLQTYTFALKYTGENIASVMYANDGKAVSMGGGLLSIGFTAIAFVAGVMLFRKSKSKKVKFGYVAGVLIVMAVITIRNHIHSANNVQGAGAGLSHMAFGMGMMTLFLSLGALALAFFAEQTRVKCYIGLLIVLLIGGYFGFFNIILVVPLMLIFLAAFPEYKKMQWVIRQPGYPYFNERFEAQQEHADYEPLHKLDHHTYAEMMDIGEAGNAQPAYDKSQEQSYREQQRILRGENMTYTLRESESGAEMPGIEDIREIVEPLPEPEVPDADAIPDPVWKDEPAEVPDIEAPKWEMPEANWDIPDVASDIPDLPDIPDIPKL